MHCDIRLIDHGPIVLLKGVTEAGKRWLNINAVSADMMHWRGAVACEPRYVDDILDGAHADGLEIGT